MGNIDPNANPWDLENEHELDDIDTTEDTWE